MFEQMYSSSVTDPVTILEKVVNEIDWIGRMYTCKYSDSFQTLKTEIQLQILSFKYDL